jgi:restriction system protein
MRVKLKQPWKPADNASTTMNRNDEYEHHVAELLRREGWHAVVVGGPHDGGVDIVAERDGRRMAVQVKNYGGGRPINAAMVRELYGAARCADCNEAMIATDARVLDYARCAATKLDVTLRDVPAPAESRRSAATEPLSFSAIWEDQVKALIGRTLIRPDGSANDVLDVNGGGLLRRTSRGRTGLVAIEIFRWAIQRLLDGRIVTRVEIDEQYPGRASSGVVLVLLALPMFEATTVGRRQAVRLRAPATAARTVASGAVEG